MGKPRMIGQFKPCTPNSRADMRRVKQYRRNREYSGKHEEIVEAKREAQQIQKAEEGKRSAGGCYG